MANTSRPPWRPPWKFLLPFTAVHAVLSFSLTFLAFKWTMDRFDSGLPPTFADKAVEVVSQFLISPIFKLISRSTLSRELFSGLLGYLPLLANSVLWAFLTWWLVLGARHFVRPQPSAKP